MRLKLNDSIPYEESVATLVNWLLTYGYEWIPCEKLFETEFDENLTWTFCVQAGVLEDDIHKESVRLTPKIHELLKEYENGH